MPVAFCRCHSCIAHSECVGYQRHQSPSNRWGLNGGQHAVPTAVVIVAAGRGSRAAVGEDHLPKQYRRLGATTVLAETVQAFVTAPDIHMIQVVVHPDDHELYSASLGPLRHRCRAPVHGGATRQASVLAGLEAIASLSPVRVLIHDAARPFVSPSEIASVIAALNSGPAAICAIPVSDTLKRQAVDGTIAETVNRGGLWRASTPQGFRFDLILEAHRKALAAGETNFTDDASIAEWANIPVQLVSGSNANSKLTTADDLIIANHVLSARSPAKQLGPAIDIRTGTGFDVHKFAEGDAVWLCGVRIQHTHRLDGHSDADVGLHALTDAILGALGDGDIGEHFPPSDPKWKGAASHLFLEDAARRTTQRGAHITNVDVTLLCELPKISPHRDAMRAAIALMLGLDVGRVGVKATTTEGLGFTGRREGIAAMASATLVFPT